MFLGETQIKAHAIKFSNEMQRSPPQVYWWLGQTLKAAMVIKHFDRSWLIEGVVIQLVLLLNDGVEKATFPMFDRLPPSLYNEALELRLSTLIVLRSYVQATTHLAKTTVLADFRALTIFSAIYVVHCNRIVLIHFLRHDHYLDCVLSKFMSCLVFDPILFKVFRCDYYLEQYTFNALRRAYELVRVF